jgi:hypothetical protein
MLVLVMAALPLPLAGQVPWARAVTPASPYTAEYKITHTQRLTDGNLANLESKEVVAVDSLHSRTTAKTEP